jgi:integrase
MARNEGAPLAEKRRARKVVPTFRVVAETVHKTHAKAWKNAKHGDQWINTLKAYAYPALGDRRVDQIDTPDILKALQPIWLTKQETARRVRQRIGTVLDWAKAAGYRSGSNPVEEISKALPRQSERKGHHAAMPYGFGRDDAATIPDLAFEFLILTAARTGEVLEARWEEIDLEQAAWTIPAGRMKAGREHASRWHRAALSSSNRPSCLLLDYAPPEIGLYRARVPVGVSGLGVGTHQLRP